MALIKGTDNLLKHQAADWAMTAVIDRADRRLTVQAYDLGDLPLEQRVIDRRELLQRRAEHREIFEERVGALCRFVRSIAEEHGCQKLSVVAPPEDLPLFLAVGLVVEAVAEGCYLGQDPRCWLGETLASGNDPRSESPSVEPAVDVNEEWLMAQVRLDRAPRHCSKLTGLGVQMAAKGILTMIGLADPGSAIQADALRQAGYRYRGLLVSHTSKADGPMDLSMWVRSTADLL